MHLVDDHMLQLLVVDGPAEDVGLQRLACNATREVLLASWGEAVSDQLPVDLCRGCIVEGRAVPEKPLQDRGFGADTLEHLANGHARGEAVRIHDEVWTPPLLIEGHVLLAHDEPDDALLAVPRGELVADLRTPCLPRHDLVDRHAVVVAGQDDPVDVRRDGILVRNWRGFVACLAIHSHEFLRLHGRDLVRENEAVLHFLPGTHHAIISQSGVPHVLSFRPASLVVAVHARRRREHVLRAILIHGHRHDSPAHDVASPEAPIQGGAAHDDGVLNVVAAVAHHGDGCVLPGAQMVEFHEVQRLARAQRLLRVREA
mmetsp:Transcript_1723/g.6742  ORF Transcript_1723/g.6742 Transcript_1723/m.6742 type:complete len:315 (-) Transcript_1723:2468-3412(-)